jgi:hypothetical protein
MNPSIRPSALRLSQAQKDQLVDILLEFVEDFALAEFQNNQLQMTYAILATGETELLPRPEVMLDQNYMLFSVIEKTKKVSQKNAA